MRSSSLLLAALVVCGGLYLWRPGTLIPQNSAPQNDLTQVRIIVGLTDDQPKDWAGNVAVEGGALTSVKGWRFSQQDQSSNGGAFSFRTKRGALENQLRPGSYYGQTNWSDPNVQRLVPQGLIVQIRGNGSRRVTFTSKSGTFDFAASDLKYGVPMKLLNGNASAELLPVEGKISQTSAADDYAAITVTPEGATWVSWLSYENGADTVLASGAGQIHKLTGPGDHHAPTLAADGKAKLWAVWSQSDNGTFRLHARFWSGSAWSVDTALTSQDGNDIWPRLVSDGKGRIALVWMGFRKSQSVILLKEFRDGKWTQERQISEGAGNCWSPSAAFGGGKLWIAWDSYKTGNYQIYAREAGGPVHSVTHSPNFCVRPSIAVNAQGKPVVAWEESDQLWGKDFAFLFDRRSSVIYKNRRIGSAYLDSGKWKELAADFNDAAPAEMRRFVQQPQLAMDPDGRLYAAFRVRTATGTSRIDFWAAGGRWETFLTHLDGDRWAPAVPMPSSVGRNGMTSSLAIARGRVHVAWSTDNRRWPAVKYGDLDVYSTSLPVEGDAARLTAAKASAASAEVANAHPNEAQDVQRIRTYRYQMNGKSYRILRGDLHRHTELSNDGAGDGSLDDLYRYTLDAAAMDYSHVGDHQMGNDEEYNWWITQKSNDLYYMPRRFVPLYGYERSVWYPNGHRNVVWAVRGKPVLKIGPDEAKGEANSGPIIYPYLRKTNGIATSHSSATDQGTDWRDNDPDLEPIVEIYQGFESNYEHAGAPRAWKKGEAEVHQGEKPAGYVWNAWAKGYKLGVQSSSDHISTHSSYACILVEDFTREGLVDAMRKRHSYGATDNIVLDYRIRTADKPEALMGDIFETKSQPKLIVKVQGTAPIKRIDVIKNNQYIHKVDPSAKEASFEYVDNAIATGENYYYVRVEQQDGQLAWSSPIWVRYNNSAR